MNRIKSIFYNNSLELLISSLFGIFVIAYVIVAIYKNSTRFFEFFVVSLVIFIIFSILYFNGKEKYNYTTITYSKLRPNYAWINQKVKRNRDKEVCPKDEFKSELDMLMKKLPDNKTYFCCTHEKIIKSIKENFSEVNEFKVYDKDLLKYKKQLQKKNVENVIKYVPLQQKKLFLFML